MGCFLQFLEVFGVFGYPLRRKVYVQELKGVDPNLQLKELRQHMLDITPMRLLSATGLWVSSFGLLYFERCPAPTGSMCGVGKVRYFHGIVVAQASVSLSFW